MSGKQAVKLFSQPEVRRVMVLLAVPDQADLHGRHVEGQWRHLQGEQRCEGFGQARGDGAERVGASDDGRNRQVIGQMQRCLAPDLGRAQDDFQRRTEPGARRHAHVASLLVILEAEAAGWLMRLFMRRRIERESQASMQALHDVLART